MTHFDIHGNMLPDAVTLLKSFQPDMSPMALSHLETSFVPEGSSSGVSKSQNETETIQELLDFRNENTTQAGDKDVHENGQQDQDVTSQQDQDVTSQQDQDVTSQQTGRTSITVQDVTSQQIGRTSITV